MRKRVAKASEGVVKVARRASMVDPQRVRRWKGPVGDSNKPVIYWMSRDRRVADNWALLYAIQEAQRTHSPIGVAFNLVDYFLGGCARQFGFMVRGLRLVEPKLKALNIPFFFLQGHPADTLSDLVMRSEARLLVMDYLPLRIAQNWKNAVKERIECALEEVDAHNIVPVWIASDKREYAARTIRPKINNKLPEFLTDYPALQPLESNAWPEDCLPEKIDWDGILDKVLSRNTDVPEIWWARPGEDAAQEALEDFLRPARLEKYAAKRNDPSASGQSGLSPFFHFGFLSAQRAAFETQKRRTQKKYVLRKKAGIGFVCSKESVDSFLEEMIVRRELSDNFCHYTPNYDSLEAASAWAQESLQKHINDKREYIYTKEQLDKAQTHDELWNACQKELVHYGKMHGYMRMYWAKKILEWTTTPAEALEICICFNDRYLLDGRDPNGIVGCMWSIAGIHDRAFKERDVIGKIRPMTYNGCKRKFDIKAYIAKVNKIEARAKAASS